MWSIDSFLICFQNLKLCFNFLLCYTFTPRADFLIHLSDFSFHVVDFSVCPALIHLLNPVLFGITGYLLLLFLNTTIICNLFNNIFLLRCQGVVIFWNNDITLMSYVPHFPVFVTCTTFTTLATVGHGRIGEMHVSY